MVDVYEQDVTATERNELDDAFAVQRLVNARHCKHLVATSLFWKNPGAEEADLLPITKELMQNAAQHGLISRHAPWDNCHFVLEFELLIFRFCRYAKRYFSGFCFSWILHGGTMQPERHSD